MTENDNILRLSAEMAYAEELEALRKVDNSPKPTNWSLSPSAVVTYLLGGQLSNGTVIEPKYFGNKQVIEIAVATLATDRALLLIGVPGTAKTWVSEHLAAAISGDSSLLVQGTAGLDENLLRYGWNYARLLAEGPSEAALVPSPIMKAMQAGKIARVEELTRIPSDVQDTLITLLSEKVLPIPELNTSVQALRGFNIIATANTRDKGVNELSSALRRRFNTVLLGLPKTLEEEVSIVANRVKKLGKSLELQDVKTPIEEIRRLVTIFRELRNGMTEDGQNKLKSPSGTLSTAEVISVINNGMAMAAYFGDGLVKPNDLAAGLTGTIIQTPTQDRQVWLEYLETVLRLRKDWTTWYEACKALV
jgi:MoxR-like ATPase